MKEVLGKGRVTLDTYTISCSYEQDIEKFKKLAEKEGVRAFSVWDAPNYNYWGNDIPIGKNFIVTYIHTERLGMEVLT